MNKQTCNFLKNCIPLLTNSCDLEHTSDEIEWANKQRSVKKTNKICQYGSNCKFLLKGKCIFLHTQNEVELIKSQGNLSKNTQKICFHGQNCKNINNNKCKFAHIYYKTAETNPDTSMSKIEDSSIVKNDKVTENKLDTPIFKIENSGTIPTKEIDQRDTMIIENFHAKKGKNANRHRANKGEKEIFVIKSQFIEKVDESKKVDEPKKEIDTSLKLQIDINTDLLFEKICKICVFDDNC